VKTKISEGRRVKAKKHGGGGGGVGVYPCYHPAIVYIQNYLTHIKYDNRTIKYAIPSGTGSNASSL
jgi:hypothetical protein